MCRCFLSRYSSLPPLIHPSGKMCSVCVPRYLSLHSFNEICFLQYKKSAPTAFAIHYFIWTSSYKELHNWDVLQVATDVFTPTQVCKSNFPSSSCWVCLPALHFSRLVFVSEGQSDYMTSSTHFSINSASVSLQKKLPQSMRLPPTKMCSYTCVVIMSARQFSFGLVKAEYLLCGGPKSIRAIGN